MFSRTVKGWTQLAVQVVLLLLTFGALQAVSERRTRRFDLTPMLEFSLGEVTQNVLAQVEQPLTIVVFHARGKRELHRDLLERLETAQPKVSYELYDFDRFPDKAKALGVTKPGSAALSYGGNHAVAPAYPEESLAGGILRVVRGERRRIAFTAGHGERAPAGSDDAYGRLNAALAAENYEGQTLNLLSDAVPADVETVIVAGPKRDFLPAETERLTAYLKRGGGVLLLLEPGSLPNLSYLLATMGVKLGDDFVVERERRILGTDGLAAVVERFKPGNPITFPQGHAIDMGVVLPSARTVDVFAKPPGVEADSIAISGDQSWVMADPDRARRGEAPDTSHGDVPGSASVMVMAEVGDGNGDGGKGVPGRVLAIGDADFASDAYIDLLGNRDLALNAIAWLVGEQALGGARQTQLAEVFRPLSPLVITDQQARWVLLAATVIQPGLVILIGATIVLLRRRRG